VHRGEGADAGYLNVTYRATDKWLRETPITVLRGETKDGLTLFVSHSTWASRDAFVAWTESDAFRKAHGDARSPQGTLAGHPIFEGFEVVL